MSGNTEASGGAGAVGGTEGVGPAGKRPRALNEAMRGFSGADVTGGCGVLLLCGS